MMPAGSALIRPHSPLFGPNDATVTIVGFFDPACETVEQYTQCLLRFANLTLKRHEELAGKLAKDLKTDKDFSVLSRDLRGGAGSGDERLP